MLPKSQRLNLKKDFKWVASGKKFETKYLKLFIREGDNKTPRVGIAISSQTFRKATERSRAKRLAATALQTTYYLLPTTINIVALPKAAILGVKSQEVMADLEQALKNVNLIN